MSDPAFFQRPGNPDLPFNARQATLGDILVQVGVLTPDQLQLALRQDPTQKNLPEVLENMGFATEEKILKGVSIQMGIPYFRNLDGILEPETARSIPENVTRKNSIIPLFRAEDSLIVGMANPADITVIDQLALSTGLQIRPVMVPLRTIIEAQQKLASGAYGPPSTPGATLFNPGPLGSTPPIPASTPITIIHNDASMPIGEATSDTQAGLVNAAQEQMMRYQADDQSVTKELNVIIEDGILNRASDIHLEAGEKVARVRYRIDGIMHDGRTFEMDRYAALVARVKILAELDITETRLPQDGHISYVIAAALRGIGRPAVAKDKNIDLRVSTVRGVFGEKVVMRILDSNKALKKLTDLEFSPTVLKQFSQALHVPNNVILVTGPTGSGKTTTLYGALTELNDLTRNIITLEDPVEYRIDRITQIEVHPKIGLTFAAGLRSVLRQDPNVVLVGEIRDVETAEIAIQVAITGHQVFSTLHTNDAVGAVNRLITMKVEPFLIAAALGGIMAQRLLRRVCDKCSQPTPITETEKAAFNLDESSGTFFTGRGCPSCFNTGYAGRIPVHEWLRISRTIKDMIVKGASVDELRDQAVKDGMVPLRDDAIGKALAGKTSLTEVLRVTKDELD